ncbi:alpha-L-fucosidase [Kribbella sp. NBC_01245]|uniref:alpha-L-fucosidase n=1 Tax=Kribbella sp. NBC_01245 TaxID=2903578 RepID=UPI002E2E7129|nr:alpha-L-fucosidase [Kribbella sp. NBC_01245]
MKIRRLIVLAMIPVLLFASSWAYGAWDDRKAEMTTSGPFEASAESLNRHPVPKWFEDAKFGIFIHWGLFSVPGYAPKGSYTDVLRADYGHAMTRSPHAEDYWNAMRDPGSPTAAFHRRAYGELPYEGFKPMFEKQLEGWSTDRWADQFQRAGGKYVVMVAKYHDGFALWPTKVKNPHKDGWFTQRDLAGELAAATRKRGMKLGVYYSGGVDWTFQRKVVKTLGDYTYLDHGSDYADLRMRRCATSSSTSDPRAAEARSRPNRPAGCRDSATGSARTGRRCTAAARTTYPKPVRRTASRFVSAGAARWCRWCWWGGRRGGP